MDALGRGVEVGGQSFLDYSPLSLSLPWAITLKLTWLVLIQITLTMHTNGNHVSTHNPQKNALVQIPMTLLHGKIYSRVQPALQLQKAPSSA